MAKRSRTNKESTEKKIRPATTPEARENQMIGATQGTSQAGGTASGEATGGRDGGESRSRH